MFKFAQWLVKLKQTLVQMFLSDFKKAFIETKKEQTIYFSVFLPFAFEPGAKSNMIKHDTTCQSISQTIFHLSSNCDRFYKRKHFLRVKSQVYCTEMHTSYTNGRDRVIDHACLIWNP